jgi:hypothetical protein
MGCTFFKAVIVLNDGTTTKLVTLWGGIKYANQKPKLVTQNMPIKNQRTMFSLGPNQHKKLKKS